MNVLVTGGAGFIGSNFIHYMLKKYPYTIVNYDALTYSGNVANLTDIENYQQYTFVKGDIRNQALLDYVIKEKNINTIVHFAAESHVDRSIADPNIFVSTNVLGTNTLLEVAKDNEITRFIHISTDEVYGSLGARGYFTEQSPLAPSSPYSASKASSDLLVLSYYHTYGFPAIVTRCSNNYGPYQYPEKLLPLMIINALNDEALPVYGDGKNIRDWLHVRDHCSAIDIILHKGISGEVYNIGGNNEKENLELVQFIVKKLGKSEELITFVKDRLGHDRRYAIDATKLKTELGWQPSYSVEQGIEETIEWYLNHEEWWRPLQQSRG